ncbi:hypothetical protein AKO1_007730 [Acrasis kona]|uniref:Uncharacterized protein n=1 Tax=Acrasis kona TaxID=1008807 RepID=A0AAW2YTP9_9EUKA
MNGLVYVNDDDDNLFKQYHLPLAYNSTIKHVSCGFYHTIIITSDDGIFVMGRNDEGQLGIINKTNQKKFIEIEKPLEMKDLKMSSCGSYFTQVLTNDGKIFGTGRGKEGQLGTGRLVNVEEFTMCPSDVFDTPVVQINCSQLNTVCVTKSGKVYHCGHILHLEDKGPEYVASFRLLPITDPIQTASVGMDNVLCKTMDGLLYLYDGAKNVVMHVSTGTEFVESFSCSFRRNLILTSSQQLYQMIDYRKKRIKKFKRNHIKHMFSDLSPHDLFVTDNDEIKKRSHNYDSITNLHLPKHNNHTVVMGSTGYNHSVIITGQITIHIHDKAYQDVKIKFYS